MLFLNYLLLFLESRILYYLFQKGAMTKLCNAQNIGKVLELKLNKVGIDSLEELKNVGAETAFAKVKEFDHNAGRSTLFSLDGAISGVAWHKLNEDRKEELREFFGKLVQKN